MLPKKPSILEIAFVILVVAGCVALGVDMQSPNWTFPFFSGAEQVLSQGQWLISKSDYYKFVGLSELEKLRFNFSDGQDPEDLVGYTFWSTGFVHVIILAKLLLPFIPPILALVVLQVIIHCLICVAVVRQFSETYLKLLFIVLYGLNPVALKFVCFAFYYFWQIIPSFFLVLYLLDKKSWGAYLLPVAVVLGFSLGIRGTSLLVVLAFLLLCVWRERSSLSLISIALVFGIKVFLYSGDAVPWHTIYIGVGGYENSHGVFLSDLAGYKLFKEKTETVLNTIAISGNFYDAETREIYFDVVKEGYLTILKESPLLLFSNAIKNTLAGYSFGYFVGSPLLQWLAIISGGSFGLILLALRQYFWFLAIGLSLITFTSFYPPIPAYMYGSYLIIVVAFLRMLKPLHFKMQNAGFISRPKE